MVCIAFPYASEAGAGVGVIGWIMYYRNVALFVLDYDASSII